MFPLSQELQPVGSLPAGSLHPLTVVKIFMDRFALLAEARSG